MKLNVGGTDRMVRIVIAIVAAIVAIMKGGTLGIVLWVVAAIMLVTAVVRVCPLYMPFKINTNKASQGS
jgi:type IV secretory pathway TrbD component